MNLVKISLFITFVLPIFACRNENIKPGAGTGLRNNVAILVYPGIELLNFAGPAEVLSNAGGFNVYTVSVTPGKVHTSKGLIFLSDYNIDNAPQPDILIIPGGPLSEMTSLVENTGLIKWIKIADQKSQLTMSVCTGILLLSKANLLDNKTVTTHATALDTLRKLSPKVKVISNVKFVGDGKLLSTAGITSGIDGALHMVAQLSGMKVANSVAKVLEYDKWDPDNSLILKHEISLSNASNK